MKKYLLLTLASSFMVAPIATASQHGSIAVTSSNQQGHLDKVKSCIGAHKGKLLIAAGALSLYSLTRWYQESVATEYTSLVEQAGTLFTEYLNSGALEKAFSALDNKLLETLKVKYARLNRQEYIELLYNEYKNKFDYESQLLNISFSKAVLQGDKQYALYILSNQRKLWSGFNELQEGVSPELKKINNQVYSMTYTFIASRLGAIAAQGTLLATGVYTIISSIRRCFSKDTTVKNEPDYQGIETPEIAQ